MTGLDDRGDVFVVLTALKVEYLAVRAHLAALRERRHPMGTIFEIGFLNGTSGRIALAEVGEGNQTAAALTERAAQMFRPRAIFFVGVAGGLKPDVMLGDIIAAAPVYAIHGGKEVDGEFLARPRAWNPSHELEQIARSISRDEAWLANLPGAGSAGTPVLGAMRPPQVWLKPIASGEVVLNSADSPLREQLRRNYNDAVAIEMEGAGMSQAAHLNGSLPAMVVRGVSDKSDGNKYASDGAGWQSTAAANAAAFAIGVIRKCIAWDAQANQDDESSDEAQRGAVSAPIIYTSSSGRAELEPAVSQEWKGGAVVELADTVYLLHDEYTAELPSPDHSVIRRQALARRLSPDSSAGDRNARYVWLRQTEIAHPGPDAGHAMEALRREHELLMSLPRGMSGVPRAGRYFPAMAANALAMPWPTSRSSGQPCQTLMTTLGREGEQPDLWRMHRLLRGFAGLCNTLAALHAKGVAHRGLTPAGIVVLDDGRLVLRDLGLAALAPVPGEGASDYQAPEQRYRGAPRTPGVTTDVYRLAAIAYHILVGRLPASQSPPPLRGSVPDLSDDADRAIRAALAAEPELRPAPRTLAATFRAAAQQLSQGA